MKETVLRTLHRRIGITVAVFVAIQTLTGLLFSIGAIVPGLHPGAVSYSFHLGGGLWGNIYRIVLALGILFMAGTGSWIFFKIRSRNLSAARKKSQPAAISR